MIKVKFMKTPSTKVLEILVVRYMHQSSLQIPNSTCHLQLWLLIRRVKKCNFPPGKKSTLKQATIQHHASTCSHYTNLMMCIAITWNSYIKCNHIQTKQSYLLTFRNAAIQHNLYLSNSVAACTNCQDHLLFKSCQQVLFSLVEC